MQGVLTSCDRHNHSKEQRTKKKPSFKSVPSCFELQTSHCKNSECIIYHCCNKL
jgi:hypothetical protein